tara:strand:- start:26303 stop:27286 length:984 start_codon:yes stop_codon:yes gene_type:complete
MHLFHYQSLTPDLILEALEHVDIYPETGLLPLNSYENRVYQFRGAHDERYVVKFYRPGRWTTEQIQEELDFALELAQEDIPVAAPLSLKGNTLHQHRDFQFALFPSIGGRTIEVDNISQFKEIGRFIGRMHQKAASQPFRHRPEITFDEWGNQALAQLKQSQHVPYHLETPYFTIFEQVLEKVERKWNSASYKAIRLHGDLHPSNILCTHQGLGFVDLDDARMGPAIQDLWMLLSGTEQEQQNQLNHLLEGYQTFCALPQDQLQLIEVLRTLRITHYTAWLSRRWQDPAFPHNFPWFTEDKYWEQQILILKEQFSALDIPQYKLNPL